MIAFDDFFAIIISENSRIKASSICEKLGIDLPTYMRMCISRLIQENGIPFTMNLNDLSENKAIKAMKSASRIAAENGLSDMTLDEMLVFDGPIIPVYNDTNILDTEF